jgi:hypothetical protein
MLPKSHSNIGYALEWEGRMEEGMPYFAMAYYGHVIAGDLFNREKLVKWMETMMEFPFIH